MEFFTFKSLEILCLLYHWWKGNSTCGFSLCKPLFHDILNIKSTFSQITFVHVYKDRNKEAVGYPRKELSWKNKSGISLKATPTHSFKYLHDTWFWSFTLSWVHGPMSLCMNTSLIYSMYNVENIFFETFEEVWLGWFTNGDKWLRWVIFVKNVLIFKICTKRG